MLFVTKRNKLRVMRMGPQIKLMKIWGVPWIQLFSLLIFTSVMANEHSILEDLQTLATFLPGSYRNVHRHFPGEPPSMTHLFLVKSEIYKMANPMFGDSYTFYFQDFLKAGSVRSGFYSFSVDAGTRTIRMKTFKIKDGSPLGNIFGTSHFDGSNRILKPVLEKQGLALENLESFSACDMFWKKFRDNIFVGVTGPGCLEALDGNQERIGVLMTLTKDKILLTEGWYKLRSGARLAEDKIVYTLKKSLRTKTFTYGRHKTHNSSSERTSNKISSLDKNHNSVNSPASPGRKGFISPLGRKFRRVHGRNRGGYFQQTTVRTYQQVVEALTDGYAVHFVAHMAGCSSAGNVKVERASFGGKVSSFMIVSHDGSKTGEKSYLHFRSQGTVTDGQHHKKIIRYITLYQDGSVKIMLHMVGFRSPWIQQQHGFTCRLYSDKTRYSDVRLTVDYKSRIKEVTNFKSIITSLDQGRDLHLVADPYKCEGSRTVPEIRIGGQITSYEFIKGQDTVDVYVPLFQAFSRREVHHGGYLQGFVGKMSRNGDVILTSIIDDQSKYRPASLLNLSPAYHCKLSNSNTNTADQEDEQSVKIFYRK